MIRKQKEPVDVKVCDDCKEPKPEYGVESNLANCFACGKDLCPKHTYFIGEDRIMAFCKEHHKVLWKFIKNMKVVE